MIEKFKRGTLRLGIVAGGQLGKMMAQEASKWSIETHILDPDMDAPASKVSTTFVCGDFRDYETLYRFGKGVDLLTFEIENVNIDALKSLENEGISVYPQPHILELIKDKGTQKGFFRQHAIPTAPFMLFDSTDAIVDAIEKGTLVYPFVQKLRVGGYDGRGVAIIKSGDDALLDGPSVVEQLVDVDKEIAILAARNVYGEIALYDAVEMYFNQEAHLVETIFSPAKITKEIDQKAKEIAANIIGALEMVGLLAVELFVTKEGEVIVNEMAPRPHNSGHHTLESHITSQMQQHLRAIIGLPLGDTSMLSEATMLNLLGSEGEEGEVYYEGLDKVMRIEGVKVHIYGKRVTKPYRKMGHITILQDRHAAKAVAEKIKAQLKVRTCRK